MKYRHTLQQTINLGYLRAGNIFLDEPLAAGQIHVSFSLQVFNPCSWLPVKLGPQLGTATLSRSLAVE
jgi:hypothetical protein